VFPLPLSRFLGLAGVVFFVAAAFTPLANVLSRWGGTSASIGPAQAIVVLAAGLRGDGTLTDASLRRMLHGVILHRMGLAPLLVFTGSSEANGRLEAEVRAEMARELGVPVRSILTETGGQVTRDEARRLEGLLQPRGVRRILLVTDSQHMTRARRLFERTGFEVLPVSVDDVTNDVHGPEQRLRLMRWVLQEFAARLYYRLAGYL